MGSLDLTGLAVDSSLSRLLEKAEEKHVGWLRVEIVNDKFSSVQEGKQAAGLESEFNAVAASLGPNPSYFLVRASPDRWLCLVYLPGGKSGVNPKNRLYAASAPALQYSVSSDKAKILGEYFFDGALQCKYDEYVASQKSGRILTDSERVRMDVPAYDSAPIPLFDFENAKLDDEVSKAIEGFKAGSVQTVFLSLNPETLALGVTHSGSTGLDVPVAKFLTKTSPAFILHKITDAKTGSAPRDVFIYYVPKLSPPRLKVAYAGTKGLILHQLLRPTLPFLLEVWKTRHITNAAILEEMFPKPPPPAPPSKGKPLRRGRGRARLTGHTKFRGCVFMHTS